MTTADQARDRHWPGARPGRETPLLPEGSIAGRSLLIVVAIMTYLASITAGTVELIASSASIWRADIARELTIQVRPRGTRDLEADLARAAALARATPGIEEARPQSREEAEKLLEPWLGSGLDLAELPMPRLVVVRIAGGTPPDLAALRRQLAADVPTASLDDHRLWIGRLGAMAATLVVIGAVVLLLVLTATGVAIAFATRGAMSGNKQIIEVLNLVGASDGFIAREFQKHFLRLGLKGGTIGASFAMGSFALAGLAAGNMANTPGGDQVDALFGTFAMGVRGYAAIVAIALLVAAITAIVSRRTVFRNLRGLD
jgi:cell division transport system permease protein